jgi:hypothetical protein
MSDDFETMANYSLTVEFILFMLHLNVLSSICSLMLASHLEQDESNICHQQLAKSTLYFSNRREQYDQNCISGLLYLLELLIVTPACSVAPCTLRYVTVTQSTSPGAK